MLNPPVMPAPATIAIGLGALALLILILALRNQRQHNRAVRRRFRDLAGEEQRLFAFLHELGQSIGNDPSPSTLSRIIVDGLNKVVNARGGAIYLLGTENGYLHPSYVSEDCPPLIGIPVEVRKKAVRDPRTLESHVRLSRVGVDEGILGHCLTLGMPVHVKDVKNDPAFRDAFTRYGDDVAAMLAPLRHAGKDLGVLAVARRHQDGGFTANDFSVFRSAAEQSSFAIGNARIRREAHEKRRLEGELQNAREVQRILMPQTNPVVAGFRISGTNLPARIISGDYYDYLDLGDHRFGVVIADVSGKGVPAGLMMAMYRCVLRSMAPGNSSPAAVLAAVNAQLFPDIREDMFVSMVYGIIDETTGKLVIARAGHDAPLLYHRDSGKVELLRPPGLALGIDAGSVFERVTKDMAIDLLPGDCLLLYTDGVREAANSHDEEFGVDRMSETFRMAAPIGAETVLDRMQEELRQFTGDGPQMDDITLVAIEKKEMTNGLTLTAILWLSDRINATGTVNQETCRRYRAGSVVITGVQERSGEIRLVGNERERIELEQQLKLAQYRCDRSRSGDPGQLATRLDSVRELKLRKETLSQTRTLLETAIKELEHQCDEIAEKMIETRRMALIGRKFETLRLNANRTFHQVAITGIDDCGVSISHDQGAARLSYVDLSPEQREFFGLDEDTAIVSAIRESQQALAYECWTEQCLKTASDNRQLAAAAAMREDQAAIKARTLLLEQEAARYRLRPLAQPARPLQGTIRPFVWTYHYGSTYQIYRPRYRNVRYYDY